MRVEGQWLLRCRPSWLLAVIGCAKISQPHSCWPTCALVSWAAPSVPNLAASMPSSLSFSADYAPSASMPIVV